MRRYCFHLRNGRDLLLGEDGPDFVDDETAKAAALRSAREIIAADALEGAIDLSQRIEIVDENGALIAVVPFSDAVTLKGLT